MTAPPTETDLPPAPVGLFAAIYKRAPLCNAEYSIPLEQVLEEEFDQLHPPAATTTFTPQSESARALEAWGFAPDQILDARRIVSRLEAAVTRKTPDTSGEAAAAKALRAVVRLLGAQGMTAIRSGSPTLEAALATELDKLLLSELPSDTCFQDFPLTDELRVALNQYAATRNDLLKARLNRILLQAIFPSELRRIRDVRLERVLGRIRPARHAALCLSGGGIRSATFALGFVQALASGDRLIHRFHYLSTVSGGGYLGGWLSAWISHAGREQVTSDLSCAPQSKIDPEAAPLRHLRAYSNFLSPKVGLLTADMWTLIATYVRNLIVNWIVLVPLLAAIVIVPHLAASVVRVSAGHLPFGPWVLPGALLAIGFIGGVLAIRYVHKNRPEHDPAKDRGKGMLAQRGQTAFLIWCLVPLLISAMALTTAWRWIDSWNLIDGDGNVAVTFMGFGALMHVAGYLTTRRGGQSFRELVAIIGTGAIAGGLAYVVAMLLPQTGRYEQKLYAVGAAPAFLTAILLGGNLFLGLTSRKTKDPEREWSARYSAWVLIAVVSWLIVSGIVLFGADLVKQYTRAQIGTWSIGGLASIIVAKLGFSPKTAVKPKSGTREASGVTSKLVAMTGGKILPIVATVALVSILILLSLLDEKLIGLTCRLATSTCVNGNLAEPLPPAVMLTGLTLLLLGLVAGRLIDTNKFSLHAMYRARLIRAYLGASRPLGERSPDPFTGFDEHDNVFMHELRPTSPEPNERRPNDRPIHIVNIALNLVSGGNLAWQERKAAPFSVSCLHAGSHRLGYRRTSHPPDWDAETREQREGKRRKKQPIVGFYGGDNGISLGTAMTISGAAASPNMGYHSSPLVTFLMTLLNVRLGWWLGNPGPAGDQTFDRASPRLGVKPILAEMFGRTNGANPYVYLSDGGHFENIALYEMVLRRCRFIVVCDASCDEKCELTDLGNAIRKIRIDLGIPIEFEQPFAIRARSAPSAAGIDDQYYAVATIRYSEVDMPAEGGASPDEYDGTLIYVKPAFYGKEPRDVYNYATESSAFPHESTADQFFSETQFESYRALGYFTAQAVFGSPLVAKRVEKELTYDPARLPEPARSYAVTAPEG